MRKVIRKRIIFEAWGVLFCSLNETFHYTFPHRARKTPAAGSVESTHNHSRTATRVFKCSVERETEKSKIWISDFPARTVLWFSRKSPKLSSSTWYLFMISHLIAGSHFPLSTLRAKASLGRNMRMKWNVVSWKIVFTKATAGEEGTSESFNYITSRLCANWEKIDELAFFLSFFFRLVFLVASPRYSFPPHTPTSTSSFSCRWFSIELNFQIASAPRSSTVLAGADENSVRACKSAHIKETRWNSTEKMSRFPRSLSSAGLLADFNLECEVKRLGFMIT